MNRVVIVDDDMIVRVTLRSLICWEEFGFTIAADFNGGKSALEYFLQERADLLITDMKMPDLDGIALMEQLQRIGKLPVTIALSGYNEFSLVREAFRVGAFDYLMKSDLNQQSLKELLEKLNKRIFLECQEKGKQAASGDVFGFEELKGPYGVVVFEVDEPKKQTVRFQEELTEMLQKPLLELARQLPRVVARGRLKAIDSLHYVLTYHVGDFYQYHHTILSVVRQLQAVWRDYMNLTLSAAISEPAEGEQLYQALENSCDMLRLAVLSGKRAICTEWECRQELEAFLKCRKEEEKLAAALYAADEVILAQEKPRFFEKLVRLDFQEGCRYSLAFIALLAYQFRQYEDDFSSLFPEEISYREKIGRLSSMRELEIWLNNYFRWVMNYTENRHDNRQADTILRAKRFLADNFANPELTLKATADYVGLNEKYFSSRFTKEAGETVSAYLTDLRMQRAKRLLVSTDLKMYEISERVGYRSVEHFNRTFKKIFGVSPKDYRIMCEKPTP